MNVYWLVMLAALAFPSAATATQDSAAPSAAPQGTVIRSGEIETAASQNPTAGLSDSVLRVVPIGSRYNVAVAVVRRSPVKGHILPDALVHDSVTEVYQILEGRAVLVMGGALEAAQPVTDAAILGEIGPSSAGQSIAGGTRHQVGPGDIVVVPAGTPHGFVEITTPRIVYTILRIDPERVLGSGAGRRE